MLSIWQKCCSEQRVLLTLHRVLSFSRDYGGWGFLLGGAQVGQSGRVGFPALRMGLQKFFTLCLLFFWLRWILIGP